MAVALVHERPFVGGTATVSENSSHKMSRNLPGAGSAAMTDVVITTHDHTTSISIARMITHWPHELCSACIVDVIAGHFPFYFHTVHFVALPVDRRLERLATLDTVCVTIAVPLAALPLVGVSRVQQ